MPRSAAERKPAIKKPKINDVIQCRGALWRFIKEENDFWNLELIRQGAHFSETPVQVWAIPNLEIIKNVEGAEAFCPTPSKDQIQKSKLLKPSLSARNRSLIEAQTNSKAPLTAMNCAIEYKEWQFEPWNRIVDRLPFPRILIADDVGLGKTTEAAIVLAELTRRRRADRVLIVAPQHLCEKWQDELFNRFGLAFEIYNRATRERLSDRGVTNPWEVVERVIVSRDFAKRWENLKPLSNVQWDVVVIDECHHFVKDETGTSTRLRDFAEKIAYKSPGLILLSATPYTGAMKEFQSLLTLLDPKFADQEMVKWDKNSPYLVRRLKRHVKEHGENILDRKVEDIKITESDLSKAELEAFELVTEELAAQRKSGSAESWDRLLEEVARKRLSSSWEAFHETISSEGRLSTWFSEKTKQKVGKICEKKDSAKLKRLAQIVKAIIKAEPAAKIVVFTEAIKSQEAIAEYLITKGEFAAESVTCIDGSTDANKRVQIEDNFANPNSKLKVLVATDTISEGKDLQHACHHLIHFELPWSLVKIEQRNGRIDRLGQTKSPVISNLILDLKATPDQRVMSKLRVKIEAAQDALGSVSPILESLDLNKIDSAIASNDYESINKEIDEQLKYLKEFGLDATSVTPLTPAPTTRRDENHERRTLFDLMVTELGGSLRPVGTSKLECDLILPKGWSIPGLLLEGFRYPDESYPWRVTFNPEHYMNFERFKREGGEALRDLQFLSPVHPIVLQAEARFRHSMARRNYPIFGVKNAPANAIVVVELTSRAPSGRIVAQEMRSYSVKDCKRIEGKELDVVESAGQPKELPKLTEWKDLHEFLAKETKAFASNLASEFDKRKTAYVKEQKSLDQSRSGMKERAIWLEDIWSVDSEQSHYQICALLINQ